jgi:hypothetical protein
MKMQKNTSKSSKVKWMNLVKVNSPSTSVVASSSQPTPPEIPQLSIPLQFLNSLSIAEAKKIRKIMLERSPVEKFINPKHVDNEIAVEEIATWISETSKDGK